MESLSASPTDFLDDLLVLPAREKENAVCCYSNTILPPFQKKGYGAILKAHWLGLAAGKGFDTVYGHARPGGSQALNAKFGAVFLAGFPDWYGTGEEYKIYRLGTVHSEPKTVRPRCCPWIAPARASVSSTTLAA